MSVGCNKDDCLGGAGPDCIMPSPCRTLEFSCEDGGAIVYELQTGESPPVGGMASLAAPGDIVLSNGLVTAVIDAIDHPHYLSPTGGSIIDLGTPGGGDDSVRSIFQAAGLLPHDAVAYNESRLLVEEGLAAVQFHGHLDGHPDLVVNTRYEIRPCEPGIRIRTEMINGEPDPLSWGIWDAFYFGNRESLPFTPSPGQGFDHPSFGLTTIADVIEGSPYLVAAAHTQPGVSYGAVSCSALESSGFHSEEVSGYGTQGRIVMPRDYEVYERFLVVAEGPAVAGAADLALEVRNQLWGEDWSVLEGQITAEGDPRPRLGDPLRASVLISEGTSTTPREERIPWTQVLPDSEGRFSVRVPSERPYIAEVEAYGRVVASREIPMTEGDMNMGALSIPAIGELVLDATVDGQQEHVLAFILPSDDATEDAVRGSLFGQFKECAPLLGAPYGESPACNRVLLDGPTTLAVPAGSYSIYASAGPFSTLARQRVEVAEGGAAFALLQIDRLPELMPTGTLSADFHVHGSASFDSSIPDHDRVRAFLASELDVIASTDHDVAWDYAEAMTDLAAHEQMKLLVGLETTGHILFRLLPELPFPQVMGHWNFWPVVFDPEGPYRGAPWDELAEPGLLFTRIRDAGWPEESGVIQFNHPLADLKFGRDLGFASTLQLDGTRDLPESFDGTTQSLFHAQPIGADFRNSDYHAQEVMNGTDNTWHPAYRALWFYLLNQGVLRAGTANSDSHSLLDNVLGTPRTLVWTTSTVDDFDEVEFNLAVRDGRMMGTNGPVIQVNTTDADGAVRRPSLTPFIPGPDATLDIRVDAAPWVPVDEVRVVVNGEVVRTLADKLGSPPDPLGTAGTSRLDIQLPLAEVLPASGDAWIVVEAGHALEPNLDLDCNGFPDTGDNNRDGIIDWRDVDGLEEEPDEPCFSTTGPMAEPPAPTSRTSRNALFQAVVPDGYALAFTNPLMLDRNGDGFAGGGR